jgi:hypothetical protein
VYRWGLMVLWLLPGILFLLVILINWGFTLAVFDPRFWLPLLLMAVPALYVWREGVDVLPDGLLTHVFWPRYYPYAHLDTWYIDQHPQRHVLTIWDAQHQKVFEARTGHLTDLPLLLAALKSYIRYRHWP